MGFVSIILLNYNGLRFNKNCIDSLLLQTYKKFEIIFVDNASTDDSLQEIESSFGKEIKNGRIRIVKNKDNEGFANGNNIGHKNSFKNSKYICLLNNDTLVGINRLKELIKGIESDQTFGAVGSLILDEGYTRKTKEMFLIKNKKKIANVFFLPVETNITRKEKKTGIFYTNIISGCCFMYKKCIVKYPFPSFYFAYAEDVWLSQYILLSGYKLGLVTSSEVYHYGSGSFGKKPNDIKLFHGTKNQIINFLTLFDRRSIVRLSPIFLLFICIQLIYNCTFNRTKQLFIAIYWIIRNYDKVIQLRRLVNNNKKISDREYIKNFSYKILDMQNPYSFESFNHVIRKIITKVNYLMKLYYKFVLLK